MVKFTAEDLRRIMDRKHNIRNMSVIAHVDHGKSTLTDSLVAAAGIIAHETAGDVRMTDTREDEAERGITFKSTGISLYYEMSDESLKAYKGERMGNEYLINLIDSPGHVDFSSEVTDALCITDGALVVVDCIEGVCVQTETVLRQALAERIRPVLTVNKIDRCFLELQVDGEEAYQIFSRVIENANVIMATYEDPLLGDVQVYPEKGTVAFSSGLHGWAFTLTNFANLYASKFGVEHSKMMERLWGENFFDPATKKWTNKRTSSPSCKRGFVLFCYEPIKKIIGACMNDQKDKLWPMLQKLGVTLKNDEKELIGKPLMKRVMQTWLPAATSLLKMMIYHLPSPHTAQKYRVENLYEGPLDDQYANAIRNCDPESSLEARKEVIDRCPGRKCTDKEVECMAALEVEVKRMHTKERLALDLQRNDWQISWGNQSETRNVLWENKNLQTDRKADVMALTDLKIFPKLGEQVEHTHTKERLALDLQRRRISWGNQSERRNVIWENKNLQTDRKANVMTLTDLKIFPKVGEQGGEAIAGTLEVQANGFFYTTSSPVFHFHFLYRDVKKAFFQVEDKKKPPLLHFHLHDLIKVGREKRRNIQFHLVQSPVGQRRSYNSSDKIMKEKQTRDRAHYEDLENFIIDVQDKWRFIPVFDHYPFIGAKLHKRNEFQGHLPSKPATVFNMTFAAVVGLVDEPFVVADLDEIEIVYLRLKPEVIDMTIVFQNLKRELVQINSIPIDALNLLKDHFNFAGVKYYEKSVDLDWGTIVKELADSQQTANYCPEVYFANQMLKVN